MAKFYGEVGYGVTSENPAGSGIWKDTIVGRNYYGDVTRNYTRHEEGSSINDDINVSNTISILADPFANNNFANIKYIVWMGEYWKVKGVEVAPPRLILSIGGVYNGDKATASNQA